MIVSNIGSTPDFSAIYTSNSGMHTASVQVSLKEDHRSAAMNTWRAVRERLAAEMPELTSYFQSGGLVDAVLSLGMPAPIDVQVAGSNMQTSYRHRAGAGRARSARSKAWPTSTFRRISITPRCNWMWIARAPSEMGLTQKEVVGNIITALTSNAMIAPSFWIDPKTGNDYMLTVQYPERQIQSLDDLRAIPIRGAHSAIPTRLDMVSQHSPHQIAHRSGSLPASPHDRHLCAARWAKIWAASPPRSTRSRRAHTIPKGVTVTARSGAGHAAELSQFRHRPDSVGCAALSDSGRAVSSFLDPVLILTAVPPGLTGALLILYLTGTSMNVMSLMGLMILIGMTVSDSILIVEFTRHLREDGMTVRKAVVTAARVRLRPVLMTSLATIIGLLPMALKLGAGSESYAPLARAVLGGMSVSLMMTVIMVPAAYYVAYRKQDPAGCEEA